MTAKNVSDSATYLMGRKFGSGSGFAMLREKHQKKIHILPNFLSPLSKFSVGTLGSRYHLNISDVLHISTKSEMRNLENYLPALTSLQRIGFLLMFP